MMQHKTFFDKPNKDQIAPKKIHFIWVGGSVPEAYLGEMLKLASIARHSNFEVNLWVDKPSNFTKPFQKKYSEHFASEKSTGIRIRNIEELRHRIIGKNADVFYKENKLEARQLLSCIATEMVGFKNLAAAADILRYEILRQEGGCYLDADMRFILQGVNKLQSESLPFGFKIQFYLKGSPERGYTIDKCNNAVILSMPDGDIIQAVLLKVIDNYKNLNKPVKSEYNSGMFTKILKTKLDEGVSSRDMKRYPYMNSSFAGLFVKATPRSLLTMSASGPEVFSFLIDEWNKPMNGVLRSLADVKSLAIGGDVMGIGCKHDFALSWVSTPEPDKKNKQSFGTESIPDVPFLKPKK